MKIYIYDIEVFASDWIVVFENADDESDVTVIHNNNYKLKQFISQKDIVIGGFNTKHYDDWVLQSMLNGANNEIVKAHNDFIIKEDRNGWEFPFIQYQKKYFRSFDLRDDLPIGLSLKAIEGNMFNSIVESSVSFDIDRKLTPEELAEVIMYCKTDVKNTVKLFHTRKKYIDSKKQVARLKGMDEYDAICLTNAKLTAKFLDAKKIKHDDEMVYEVPEELRIGKYTEVLEFFKDPVAYTIKDLEEKISHETRKIKLKSLKNKLAKIKTRYDCKLEMKVAGIPHKYGWGGIHGDIKKTFIKAVKGYKIVTIDVGSYYPSLALQYNYVSRNIPNAKGYADIYHMRMKAKHSGDKATADALKLILNTFYGAMKNRYNDLYDPRNASAICITGMLFLTDLIDKLEAIKGFELIQSNTDGIIIRYPIEVESQIEAVVTEWEKRTRMNMEYTVIHAIAQKDVNNYVMKAGETYLIKDGVKVVTGEDKGKLKSKGGYVSLADGGDFKNNSLVVLNRALVNFFMYDIPIEKTINECQNMQDFQMIAKTGSSYDSTYWEVDGEKIDVQRVNRVYASKNPKHGTLFKVKNGVSKKMDLKTDEDDEGRSDKIASLPDHAVIDNENKLTIDQIDKSFYIALANKRVKDYLGRSNKHQVIKEDKQMATEKKASNIYAKLLQARKKFLTSNVKKTGINRFAEFKYFELADIVPVATSIFDEVGLLFYVYFTQDYAYGNLINTDNPDEKIVLSSPMRPLNIVSNSGKNKMNELQGLGAEQTYQRRYLYLMCLDIVEADVLDATSGKTEPGSTEPEPKKQNRPASPEQRAEIKNELINKDGQATETQIKSIKRGLKKLREKNEEYEPYIAKVAQKIMNGLTNTQANELLIEVGNKVEE